MLKDDDTIINRKIFKKNHPLYPSGAIVTVRDVEGVRTTEKTDLEGNPLEE